MRPRKLTPEEERTICALYWRHVPERAPLTAAALARLYHVSETTIANVIKRGMTDARAPLAD